MAYDRHAIVREMGERPLWFTGGCLTFAKALKGLLGRKATLVDVVEPQPRLEGLFAYPGLVHHVMVQLGGTYWDAAGPHTAEDVFTFWGREMKSSPTIETHVPARARELRLRVRKELLPLADTEARALLHRFASR